jgi:hypothetical protein
VLEPAPRGCYNPIALRACEVIRTGEGWDTKLSAFVSGLALLASLSLVRPASAGCIDYGDYLHCTGSAFSLGACFEVDVAGNIACVIEGQAYHGLQTIDVSDPSAPIVLGSLGLTWPWGVAIAGAIAYVADGSSGLRVISIADPAHPQLIGQLSTPAEARGVAVSGNLAYVADYTAGLLIVDVSDPQHPHLISQLDTPGSANRLATSGGYAYVAGGSAGLQVIRIADPDHPAILGRVDTPDSASDVAVQGSYAYVADGGVGLSVIDVSHPLMPRIAGSVDTPRDAQGVAVSDSYAYVADGYDGLVVIGIADPEAPVILGSIVTPVMTAIQVGVSGSQAYVVGRGGVQVVDVEDPVHPRMIGGLSPFSDVMAIAIVPPYVHAVCQQHLPCTQFWFGVLPAHCDPAGASWAGLGSPPERLSQPGPRSRHNRADLARGGSGEDGHLRPRGALGAYIVGRMATCRPP